MTWVRRALGLLVVLLVALACLFVSDVASWACDGVGTDPTATCSPSPSPSPSSLVATDTATSSASPSSSVVASTPSGTSTDPVFVSLSDDQFSAVLLALGVTCMGVVVLMVTGFGHRE